MAKDLDVNLSKTLLQHGKLCLGELKQVVARLRHPVQQPFDEASRPMLWRFFLGLLPLPSDAKDADNLIPGWSVALHRMTNDYYKLKKDTMPSADKVQADPLGGRSQLDFDAPLSQGGTELVDEWAAYEKNLELAKFIEQDLERLYMGGIDDAYFHRPDRKQILLDILLLWSTCNKHISYRQGMHEIIAPMLYALEKELASLDAFTKAGASSSSSSSSGPPTALSSSINQRSLEAHGYYMFESIMRQLNVLYDPVPKKRGTESQPEIVHFVTSLQDKHLQKLDPLLCATLTENNVYAQVYGMRWTRLLFGREFPMTHTMSFRNWDYMLSSALHNEGSTSIAGGGGGSSSSSSSSSQKGLFATPEKKPRRYGEYGPIMDVVGDVALAMMLNVRKDIMEGDQLAALGLLMHYPVLTDVTPILQLAERVGRGEYLPKQAIGHSSDSSSSSAAGGADHAKQPKWLAARAPAQSGGAGPSFDQSRNSVVSNSPAALENMAKEEAADPLPAPPSAPLPVRVLQKAGTNIGSGLATMKSGIMGGGRAVSGGILSAVDMLGSAISGKGAGSSSSEKVVIDPADPFLTKKSTALDAFQDEDDSPTLFASTKKGAAFKEDEESTLFVVTKKVAAPVQAPTTPASAASEKGPVEDQAVIVTKAVVKPSSTATNAAIGEKLQEIADALINAPSGSTTSRSAAIAKLQMLTKLLETADGTMEEYNQLFPQSAYAAIVQQQKALGAKNQAESSRGGSATPTPVSTSTTAAPSPNAKAVRADAPSPKPLTFDLAADQAAKKVARQEALAKLLDM